MPVSSDSSAPSTPTIYHQPIIKEAAGTEIEEPNEDRLAISPYKKIRKWKKQQYHQFKQKRSKLNMWPEKNSEFTLADWQCVLAIMALKQTYTISTSTHKVPPFCMPMSNIQLNGGMSPPKVFN
jgi:hypothetical protein